MKIKILPVILSVFIISLAVTSCLGSDDDNYEYSSDATVRAFEIDSIYGVYPKFTIDQINRRIFNVDSVPFSADTIINKIRIVTLTTASGYEAFYTGDTIFYMTDSLDLSNTMSGLGGTPLQMKIYAPDGQTARDYSVEVRIHQQNPDSIVWHKMSGSFSGGSVTGKQKSVVLNDALFVYASDKTAYTSPVNGEQVFSPVAPTGLPADINLSSLLNYKENLYIATASGEVYTSADGIQWTKSEALSGEKVVTFLSSFNEALTGIVEVGGTNMFAATNADATGWTVGKPVPGNFPFEETSSTLMKSTTGLWKCFLVGKARSSQETTTPWFTFDGLDWADLETPYYPLPAMEQPTIMYYNDSFYAFGEEFDYFYSSQDGLTWRPIEKSTLFSGEFSERGQYSTTVDANGYIWLLWSKGAQYNDEAWKGRINRMGFAIK